ncbi:MAG: tetratricopeptide repeat protein [Chitinophagaceae bacterium]
MRLYSALITYFTIMLFAKQTVSQKRMENIIPKDDIRKIEKARKFYNELKIYEGERILKELIKQNPNNVYYHEALVQMQRQVLRKIEASTDDIKELITYQNEAKAQSNKNDENGNYLDEPESDLQDLDANTTLLLRSGLDRNIDIAKQNKKQKDKEDQDASVRIDTNYLKRLDEDSGNYVDPENIQIPNAKQSRWQKSQLKFLEELSQIPYELYKNDLIQNARHATRIMQETDSASYYLRTLLIDTIDLDLYVAAKAKEYYNESFEALAEDNFIEAVKLLEKALDTDPNFYEAKLRLANWYVKMNKSKEATRILTYLTLKYPLRSDAWEKLSVLYYNQGEYIKASETIIEAIIAYPQQSYFKQLSLILDKTGRPFNSQWIMREVYPATTTHNFEEIVVDDKSPWWHYQYAKSEVFGYYDTLGKVRPNEKTNIPYLELYCWRKMLNNSSPKQFLFARAMEKMGYLDCYVFVSLFHNDLYYQYADFAINNFDKIKEYFYILINWEDKKFDKIRNEINTAAKQHQEKQDEKGKEKKKN